MKRFVTWTVLGAFLLCSAATALADPGARDAQKDSRLSKKNLVNSYKPAIVNGMPWYRGTEAVKLHNQRRGESARPIVLLRILGDFDSGT